MSAAHAALSKPAAVVPAQPPGRGLGRLVGHALWFTPFLLLTVLFMLLPSIGLFVGSLHTPTGHFTLSNLAALDQQQYLSAYVTTVQVSGYSAILGGLFGVGLAWAVVVALPRAVRAPLVTFSGVASNFAGVPLAFAFISTLGPLGTVTQFLVNRLGFSLYQHGFSLFGVWGLVITYLYFQAPLMVLLILPSLDNVMRWREAAQSLGATGWQYTRMVALPILRGPLLGALLLLFGSGFGAYATAYALSSGNVNLVPLLIGDEMSGNVLFNPGLADALAVGMIAVMACAFVAASLLQGGQRRRTYGA
jgi:putative spermidine/putrescine transport system permease protein